MGREGLWRRAGTVAPVHSSISFDLTVTSLFVPLMAGGCVELLPEDVGAQNLLAALLREGNRSLVEIMPAHLELLNAQITREQAAGITRAIVIGGENLVAESLKVWRDLTPPTRLINEYGPTETVVGCCVHEVGPRIRGRGRSSSAGQSPTRSSTCSMKSSRPSAPASWASSISAARV